ncbi:MAG: nitroreductase family protein [Candidatus Methanomethylicia archaeon]|nr:nitroreductase family protein [Candidatus Methanomethylicia archaeon]
MDAFQAIMTRRSVRSFLPDPVPQESMDRILEAGRAAPSAMNRQPWHFIFVTDSERRKALAGGKFAGFLTSSPLVIVGCSNKERSPKWHAVDTAIAMQNMVIAATNEGLGTCWIGSFDEAKVREALKIPGEYAVLAMIAVGFPSNKPSLTGAIASVLRNKKAPEEIASREEFGLPYRKGEIVRS